jgi:hypothetical protein
MKTKINKKLFVHELLKLSDRHRALGRLRLLHPEYSHRQLAEASGYSLGRVRSVLRSRVFIQYLNKLRERLDDQALGIKSGIDRGALKGVRYLVKVVTPGNSEYESAKVSDRVKAAIELLDRSGAAPKMKPWNGYYGYQNQGLTEEEMAQITGANDKSNRVGKQENTDDVLDAEILKTDAPK